MSDDKRTRQIICLTPVRNEAWILDIFLRATALWADRIIIMDQASDDGTREIAASHPKVDLIDNPSATFNEPERQALLIATARQRYPGSVLIALDADEIFTPEWMTTGACERLRAATPGTRLLARWANARPGMRSYWLGRWVTCGFVDDGVTAHQGRPIHSPRLPGPEGGDIIHETSTRILHYRGVDRRRMDSKHRWYQCWELLHGQRRDVVRQHRFYHSVETPRLRKFRRLPRAWRDWYHARGLVIDGYRQDEALWWDRELVQWLHLHGPERFRQLAIWNAPWPAIAQACGLREDGLCDPRRRSDRAVHRWLALTQWAHRFPLVQLVDRLLVWRWAEPAGTEQVADADTEAETRKV